ncbi:MAG: mechanosensitive ion channel [Rhodobacterales bacterium]|nr:mechanosensitive ion channel [Rhodobacterales bacterium]
MPNLPNLADLPPALVTGLVALAVLAATAVAAWIVHRILFAVLRRIAARTETELDDMVLARLRRPAGLLLLVLALFLALRTVGLPAEVADFMRQVLSIVLTAGVGWLAIGLVGVTEQWVVLSHPIDHADNLAQRRLRTRAKVLRRMVVAAIGIVTAGLILMSFPSVRQVGISLLASAGVAGLAIGMAARPALSNLIAGAQLALTDPIRLDDVVIVHGEWGRVEELTATYVVVCIWDRRRLIVPLSYFIENPVENWTRTTADILGTVFLHVDYTAPIPEIRAKLKEILDGTDLWDGKVWNLQVTDADDRTVTIRALMSAKDGGTAWDLRCLVREALLTYLQETHPAALPRQRVEVAGVEGAAREG